jgi:hypothetical protein
MLKGGKGYYGRWVMVTGDHVKTEKPQRGVWGKKKKKRELGGEGGIYNFPVA